MSSIGTRESAQDSTAAKGSCLLTEHLLQHFRARQTPGSSDASYNGSLHGNRTHFRATETGDYLIQVYLFSNAARRVAKIQYLLTAGATP